MYTKENNGLVFTNETTLQEILKAVQKEFYGVPSDRLEISYGEIHSVGDIPKTLLFVELLKDNGSSLSRDERNPNQVIVEEQTLPVTLARLANIAAACFPFQSPKVHAYWSYAPEESVLYLEV